MTRLCPECQSVMRIDGELPNTYWCAHCSRHYRGRTLAEPTVYRTIVADPPWTPSLGDSWATRFSDKARPQAHYDTLSLHEIADLPMEEVAAPQAHLYLWALSQHVDWAWEVARAWGFEPVTMLTWCKPGLGAGRFQCNTEHVVVARKGSRHGNPFAATGGTWFNWPRGEHSAKPDAFYDLVEATSPGPYLELFARRARFGWDVWGNEVDSDPALVAVLPLAHPVPEEQQVEEERA